MTDFTEKIIIGVVTLIVGIVAKHLWDKIVNKVARLHFQILHSYVGSSIEDAKFGSVKLLYNENSVKNLYSSSVIVSNNSNRDIDDLELNISCDKDSLILVSHGQNTSSLNELEFAEKYLTELQNVTPENQQYVYTRRDYIVPVLNRGDKLTITLLTTNFESRQPVLFVGTDHKGVRLEYFIEPPMLFGVSQTKSAVIGVAVSAALCLLIFKFIDHKLLVIFLSVLNGWVATFYGIAILKVNNWINKAFE